MKLKSRDKKATQCVVRQCDILCFDADYRDRLFHLFPKNRARKQKWLKALNLRKRDVTVRSRICSRHFLVTDYGANRKLKTRSVPSVFNSFIPARIRGENLMSAQFKSYDFQDEITPIKGQFFLF